MIRKLIKMRVRLSVFPLLDKQWRQNLVKKKNTKKNTILKRLYFMCCLFSFYHILTSLVIYLCLKKHIAKFDINFLSIICLLNQRTSMGVLMLLLNNLNVKVSERGRQERHKHTTQINRLLRMAGNLVLTTGLKT